MPRKVYEEAIIEVINGIIEETGETDLDKIVKILLSMMGQRFKVIDTHYMHLYQIFHELFQNSEHNAKFYYIFVFEHDACLKVRRGAISNTMIYLTLRPINEPCKFFLKGICKYGKNCPYFHPPQKHDDDNESVISDLTDEDSNDVNTHLKYCYNRPVDAEICV